MDWLRIIKPKKQLNLPIVYIIALAIVLALLAFWFSVKPEVRARDFLPESTSFYYQWTDKEHWLRNNKWSFNDFKFDQANQKIETLQPILGLNFSQIEEIIWLQTDFEATDHYLVRFNESLSKQELDSIRSRTDDYQINKINQYILLITPDPELAEQIPKMIIDKFILADNDQGINLYFNFDNHPEFLNSLVELLKPSSITGDVFLNFDLDKRQVDLYQKKSDDQAEINWTNIQLPNNYQTILGLGQSAGILVPEFLLPKLFTNSLSYYFPQAEELLTEVIILQQADSWLLIRKTDWQEIVSEFMLDFAVEEKDKLLPDGTKYTELVKPDDLVINQLEFVGVAYWQVDSLYGLNLMDNYYLSNSEELIKDVIAGRKTTNSLWQSCLQAKGEKITDFIYLDKDNVEKLGLIQYFNRSVNKFGLFSYQNSQISGIKLCY